MAAEDEGENKGIQKKVTRERKPNSKEPKTASHPPYFEMIKEALLALNHKSGSSPYAIAKYMEEKHKAVLPANFRKILGIQLKNSAARGKLVKVRASYKLAEKKLATKEKVPIIIMEKTRSATASKKKTEASVKKVASKKGKKSTPAKAAKPKQPKSIRSSVGRKAKKAAA